MTVRSATWVRWGWIAAGLIATAAWAGSQSLQPAGPVERYGAPTWALGGPGGGEAKPAPGASAWAADQIPFASGGAMTHDGGLLFLTAYDGIHIGHRGIYVTGVHPERAALDPATGLPDLSAVFDEPVRILDGEDPAGPITDGSFSDGHQGFMTVAFDPTSVVPGQSPPFRVDCESYALDPAGDCKRYDLQLILNISRLTHKDLGARWNVPLDANNKPMWPVAGNCLESMVADAQGNPDPSIPLAFAANGLGLQSNVCTDAGDCVQACSDTSISLLAPAADKINAHLFQQRHLRIHVDEQGRVIDGTTGLAPHPQWVDYGIGRTLSFIEEGNPIPPQGIEPVVTADGRLMVWQSVSLVYDPDELDQPGGSCWSYEHPALGFIARAACGVGRRNVRPGGTCDPATYTGIGSYPYACDPGPQCLAGVPGPAGGRCNNQIPHFHQQNVVYAFRSDPADPHDWSRPRNLADLYTTHGAGAANEPIVDGVPFSQRYGLGRHPIVHGDGSPVDAVRGQYFWLDPDGDWLVWNGNGHAATSIVGSVTQGHMINLDGPINPADVNFRIDMDTSDTIPAVSRNWSDREAFLGWGVSPGMWGPFLANPALPYRQTNERSLVMLGHQLNSYNEIALHEDPDRILFLHMNKGLRMLPNWPRDQENRARTITASPHVPAPNCSPPAPAPQNDCGAWGAYTDDATGNEHTGELIGVDLVVFDSDDYQHSPRTEICQAALDANGFCSVSGNHSNREHEGFNGQRSGQSIRFYGVGGYVRVEGDTPRLNPSSGMFDGGLSAGLFTRVIQDRAGERHLLDKPGSFQLTLLADGRVRLTVWLDDGSTPALTTLQPIPAYVNPGGSNPVGLPHWNHLAFSFGSEGDATRLALYVDGVEWVGQGFGVGRHVLSSANDLTIGNAPSGAVTTSDVAIDEVELWSAKRSRNEVRAMAYVTPPPSTIRTDPEDQFPSLPLGLDYDFLRLPIGKQHDLTPERVALGRALFHDTAFSRNNDMACATCHEKATLFAQDPGQGSFNGFSTLRGGAAAPRQTPPLINRAMSTAQFWDARAESLELQASQPIFASSEHAARSVPHVEFLLNSPPYDAMFRNAYGINTATIEHMELALAAYQRNLVAGDSVVDAFRAGLGSLSPSEERGLSLFFGKARCVACHAGPNLTDEALHVTVADMSSNPSEGGAFDGTGRALDWRRFKTPSLRTGDVTGHFFHNGSASTLLDVVRQYNSGGFLHGGGPSGSLQRDPEIRPLGLTAQEEADLAAYLAALRSRITELHP